MFRGQLKCIENDKLDSAGFTGTSYRRFLHRKYVLDKQSRTDAHLYIARSNLVEHGVVQGAALRMR